LESMGRQAMIVERRRKRMQSLSGVSKTLTVGFACP
jgi:hypothetical protein